jgi:hypothetical protein
MSAARRAAWAVLLTLLAPSPWAVAAEESGVLVNSATGIPNFKTVEELFVNTAQGHVSAAALASIDGDSMTVAQDLKDFTLVLKGLDKDFPTYGFSITPARTRSPFPKINLADYAKGGVGTRLLGALTLGYAQGKSDDAGKTWQRRAFSVETSAFWNESEDPVVAMANDCGKAALSTPADEADRPSSGLQAAVAAAAGASAAAATAAAAPVAPRDLRQALVAKPDDPAANKRAAEAFNACIEPKLKRLSEQWNRTRYSLSYGTGWIRPDDRSLGQTSLGHTVAASLVYGFDGLPSAFLRDRAALTVVLRRSVREPVLDSLGTAAVNRRDSTITALRLTVGSSSFRGLAEYSNAGKKDLTTTQRTFTQALGIDYAVSNLAPGDLWLSLRYGRQRKLDGSGEESASLFTLSYSGKPSLPR